MTEDSGTPARRLTRAQDGRLITGVCAGLARYTRIDAVVFRVGFALLVLATGVGILLYVGAYVLMAAPDGGPGKVEQIGRRLFDGDTVLALLGAALGVGAVLGIAGDWGSMDGLAVAVVFALALFVARSRGVDLVQAARALPDGVKGRPLSSWTPPPPPASRAPSGRTADGMIDLAVLAARAEAGGATTAPPPGPRPGPDTPPAGPYAPPGACGPVVPGYPRRPPRPRSYLTSLTLAAAIVTAGLLYAFGDHRPDVARIQVILAGALVVVSAGLFLGSWFGRDRKLITVGAIMSLALASTSIAGDPAVATRTHTMTWRPADTAGAEQQHNVFIGEGVVDLTAVPLSPGQRIRVSARVTLGVLAVRVPDTARVEVDGQAFLGDITVDRQLTGGPRARVRRVLEPVGRTNGAAPVIELRIRSKVGDMEVTRVPA